MTVSGFTTLATRRDGQQGHRESLVPFHRYIHLEVFRLVSFGTRDWSLS